MIISAEKRAVFELPDMDNVCTSYIESLNQKLRLNLKRFTRLTQAHSKSLKHHVAMQAIYFAHYNFCKLHSSLDKQTPAMAAGITDRKLQLVDLLGKKPTGCESSINNRRLHPCSAADWYLLKLNAIKFQPGE